MIDNFKNAGEKGFAGQTYTQWFLFLLFFVFAWAFVVSLHQKVGARLP